MINLTRMETTRSTMLAWNCCGGDARFFGVDAKVKRRLDLWGKHVGRCDDDGAFGIVGTSGV